MDTEHAPRSIIDAIRVDTARGATFMGLVAPEGFLGHRLSGYALHEMHYPPHRRTAASRRLDKELNSLQSRVDALREIIGSYCDDAGVIVDGRAFRAAFRLEDLGLDGAGFHRFQSVVTNADRTKQLVLDRHRDHVDHRHLRLTEDGHRRLVDCFLEWMHHDARRRATRRRLAAGA